MSVYNLHSGTRQLYRRAFTVEELEAGAAGEDAAALNGMELEVALYRALLVRAATIIREELEREPWQRKPGLLEAADLQLDRYAARLTKMVEVHTRVAELPQLLERLRILQAHAKAEQEKRTEAVLAPLLPPREGTA